MDHVTCRWIIHRWELHTGADIDLSKALEQLRGAALDQAGNAIDDQLVGHAHGVGALAFDRESHSRVAGDVGHLLTAH